MSATSPTAAAGLDDLLDGAAGGLFGGSRRRARREDTWQPERDTDLHDGRGLHGLLYEQGDLRHPRPWSAPPTSTLVARALDALAERLRAAERGDTLHVLDYGTGTGLAAIELLKACKRHGVDHDFARRGVMLELHLVDLPSSWYAQGFELLRECGCTRFHSLAGEDGHFRDLTDVVQGRKMDLVLSSMVFHLVPAKALGRVADGLADVSAPAARLLWTAPDLAPAEPETLLFHDPNRALRGRWKELLTGAAEPTSAVQRSAVAGARRRAADGPLVDDARAGRRVLPRPNTAAAVADALTGHFSGGVSTSAHEMIERETLELLLVPSNQEEYLPEIEDTPTRSALIEELMADEVLPALRDGPAATGLGSNIHWTFGDFRRVGGCALSA